ncbi:MAG: LPP20 family lipoprotein [Bacteroidales bacterium]|nr:LPP20 family lipoprotein [Bacteroidales bacterium]
MKRILPFSILLIVLAGCGTSKKATQLTDVPSWIKSRPSSAVYYVGIGSARKFGNPGDYMQAAKQNALADMSSEISVKLSSNSVLSAFETQQTFFEDYSSTVRAETQKELAGYNEVDTWEDAQNYWVYYQLSKELYQKQVEERKAKAISTSLDFYRKALENVQSNDSKSALIMTIKALEPLKPYFAETIVANYDGTDIFLGNELFSLINREASNLVLTGPKEVSFKMGSTITGDMLEYEVTNSQGVAQKGIPLVAKLSVNSYMPYKVVTDSKGKAQVQITSVKAKSTTAKLQVQIDFESIIREGTNDFAIRKILSRVNMPTFETVVNIVRPTFAINAVPEDAANRQAADYLVDVLKRKLTTDGYSIIEQDNNADFTINIDAQVDKMSKVNKYVRVAVQATITVVSKDKGVVYSRRMDKEIGSHFDATGAATNALKEIERKIDNFVSEQLIQTVVSK